MSQGHLIPPIDENNAGFWEAARRGELCVEQCASCNALRFPPGPMCPRCHASERRWLPVSGEGSIWSFVVPHPPLLPQFSDLAPYVVVVVTLAEDPTLRMVGNVVERPGDPINRIAPGRVSIGAPVRVVFEAVSESIHLPRWMLV